MTYTQSGMDIAEELRKLPEGTTSESETGWGQGFDALATFLAEALPCPNSVKLS